MSDPKIEAEVRELAKSIEKKLKDIYETDMGFFLCVCPFNSQRPIADYISNANREDACSWMLDTVKRFTNNEVIPATKGPVQ